MKMKSSDLALEQGSNFMVRIAILILVLFSTPAIAQDSNIAVIDLERILTDSSAGKSIETQLNQKREAFQKEFSSRENNLVNSEKVLAGQQASLSAEEFEKKRKEFEIQLQETRKLFQQRRNALDKALNQALDELRDTVTDVTSDLAEKENYDVVLTRESVVIIAKKMDITDEVLEAMDQRIQEIPLEMEE
ncbi:MAG: OmpH family outer membrane protein [Pseudomonadota bacterium]